MKIFVAAVTFAITMGGLFLFENYKTVPEEANYAQVVQGLVNQNQTSIPKLPNKPVSQNTIKTPIPSAVSSITPLAASISASPTSSSVLTPLPSLTNKPATPSPDPTPVESPDGDVLTGQTPTPTSTPQSTPQNNQIEIIRLTSPVEQNTTAQLDIKTAPGSVCTIKVTLPSGSQSNAKGLEEKTADNSGAISWSWKINWNTKPGTAAIEISCSKNSQNLSKNLQMEIIER